MLREMPIVCRQKGMKYLLVLFLSIPCCLQAQNWGLYIDTTGHVAIGKDTVWEPFQVFVPSGAVFTVTADGHVRINNYTSPQADGANNQVMVTNGAGTLSWQNKAVIQSSIADADSDTKVQVKKAPTRTSSVLTWAAPNISGWMVADWVSTIPVIQF